MNAAESVLLQGFAVTGAAASEQLLLTWGYGTVSDSLPAAAWPCPQAVLYRLIDPHATVRRILDPQARVLRIPDPHADLKGCC